MVPALRRMVSNMSWETLLALPERAMTPGDVIARALLIKAGDIRYGDKARELLFNRLDGPLAMPEASPNTAWEQLQLALVAAYVQRLTDAGLPLPRLAEHTNDQVTDTEAAKKKNDILDNETG